MSTTITYKGYQIANFSNDTKTLTTSGKYLEDNITIVDVDSTPTGYKLISLDTYISYYNNSNFISANEITSAQDGETVYIAWIPPAPQQTTLYVKDSYGNDVSLTQLTGLPLPPFAQAYKFTMLNTEIIAYLSI